MAAVLEASQVSTSSYQGVLLIAICVVALAKLFPNQITLALEIRPKVTEFVRLRIEALRAAHKNEYQNVAVMRSNAMRYLPHLFRKAQIQKMFFCFPDPQFKQRNHRRRIVRSHFLFTFQ